MDFKLRGQVKDSATPERLIAKGLTHFGLVLQPNTCSAIWSRGQPPTGRTGTARRWGEGINESPDLHWPEACAGLGSSDAAGEHSHQAQAAFPSLPPGGSAAARVVKGSVATVCSKGWAQDPQRSRAACPGFLWTTCGASGLAQKRARTAGSWTGLWGSHARPPPSHKTIRVLALASVELGQKEGPRVAFQKQEADVRAGSQDASVPGNGP